MLQRNYAEELLVELANSESNFTDVVIFYGESGIGKSSLCNSLYKNIAQYYSNGVSIDGEEIIRNCIGFNPENDILLKFREAIIDNSNPDWNCFDIVYSLYLSLVNSSQTLDISQGIIQNAQIKEIIEVVERGLYQFPLLLESSKYLDKCEWLSGLIGSKVFGCLNWFFIQQKEEISQWWKLRGRRDLQELKNCASLKDIQGLLPLFLARDLQRNLPKNRQKAVIFIDNYNFLVDAEGNCHWLKNFIELNNSILWVIFAQKPVSLTNNTQNIAIRNLTNAESQAVIQQFRIDNTEISQLIIQASQGIPLYLHLGIETYLTLAKQTIPQFQDFASHPQEILPKLDAAWDNYERRIWQILSNCRSWDEVLFAKLMSQFEIASCTWICKCWATLFRKVIKSPFVEINSGGIFRLNLLVEEYLYKNQPKNLQESVHSWLFEYYQAEYQQSKLRLNGLVKSLKHGLKSWQQQQAVNWFLEEVEIQQQSGSHEFTVITLQMLLQCQQNTLAFILLSKSLFALGNYQQAVITLQKAKRFCKAKQIPDNLVFATIELELLLGASYLKLQQTSDAKNAAKEALSICNVQSNHNSIKIAEIFNLQAEIALIERNYSQALELTQQALQIFESDRNIPVLQIAQTKFTTSWLNAVNKNFDIAQKLCQETLDIFNLHENKHPLVISCHELLGNIYENIGYSKYHQAYEEYQLALETAEIRCGLNHPQTLHLIAAIINFSRIRGEYDTVDFLIQRRHINMEIGNLEETPATADRLNKIGCLLYQQGDYDSSVNLLQKALQINCKVLSEQHPQTAENFHNLGLIYKTQRRYYTAEAYLKQALQIRSHIFGDEHPKTASSLNSLAVLYCCMEKYQQAEPLLNQALEICQNNFGDMHPHTATTLNNVAQMYQCLGLNAKAEPIFEKALDICLCVLGEEHPYTKVVESNLKRLQEDS